MIVFSTAAIVLWLLSDFIAVINAQGCRRLKVIGIKHVENYSLSGIYEAAKDDVCSERTVYRQLGGSGYIFSKSGNWIVGDKLCVASGSIKAADGALYPEAVTRRWEESTELGWQFTDGLQVLCYHGFSGCSKVLLSGIQAPTQYELTGVYENSTVHMCTGRTVYAQAGGSFYLFFKFGYWVLAYQPCVNQVTYKALDSTLYPELISAGWEKSVPPEWTSEPEMSVTCYAGFRGCPQVRLKGVEEPIYSVLNTEYRLHPKYTCTGRRVYQARTEDFMVYIYYKNGNWIVGSRFCDVTGTLKVVDKSMYVENVTNIWEVSKGISWIPSDTIDVECFLGFAGCPSIQIAGDRSTELFSPVLAYGVYKHMDNVNCTDLPVYEQLGGKHYVYFKTNMWRISDRLCADEAVLKAAETVSYPEDVTVVWQEQNGIVWTERDTTSVSCYRNHQGCDVIEITGVRNSSALIGFYNVSRDFCNGRPVYQSLGGALFLYYASGYWVVGNQTCAETYQMKISSVTQYPEESAGKAEEKYENIWMTNPDVALQCHTGLKGCEQVRLHNTMSSSDLEGVYTINTTSFCDGHYVYGHHSGQYFLFSDNGSWIIANTSCSGSGWRMRAPGVDLYPDEITTGWHEMTRASGATFWHTSVATMRCSGHHSMRLTGTAFRHNAVGVYDVVPGEICNERFIYRQREGSLYLYFLDGRGLSSSGWFIGPKVCKNDFILLIVSTAKYPENITGTWREKEQNNWFINDNITLTTDTGFQGCPELAVSYDTGIVNIYTQDDAVPMCNGRYTYRHRTGRYLYASGDYWYIGSTLCTPALGASARVNDGSLYPENITNHWQLPFTNQTSLRVQCRRGCSELDLTMVGKEATDAVSKVQGNYEILSQQSSCFGRRSYQHKEGQLYFYYVEVEMNNFRGWMIGSALCLDHGYARVWDPANYPEDVIHTWTYHNGSDWLPAPELRLSCLRQSGATNRSVEGATAQVTVSPASPGGLPDLSRNDVIMITCVVVVGAVIIVSVVSLLIYCLRRNRRQPNKFVPEFQGHQNPVYSATEET